MRKSTWFRPVFCSFLIFRMFQSDLINNELLLVQNLLLTWFIIFFYFRKILIFFLFLWWAINQFEFWSSFLIQQIFLNHFLKHVVFSLNLKLILRFLLFFLALPFSWCESLEKLKLLITLLYYLLCIFNIWAFLSLIA